MKKVLTALFVAGTLVAGSTAGYAAPTGKPTIKPVTGKSKVSKEGTAEHEMSETSETQKKESKTSTKSKSKKK